MKVLRRIVDGLPMMAGFVVGIASTHSLWYALLIIPCSVVIGVLEGILEAVAPEQPSLGIE